MRHVILISYKNKNHRGCFHLHDTQAILFKSLEELDKVLPLSYRVISDTSPVLIEYGHWIDGVEHVKIMEIQDLTPSEIGRMLGNRPDTRLPDCGVSGRHWFNISISEQRGCHGRDVKTCDGTFSSLKDVRKMFKMYNPFRTENPQNGIMRITFTTYRLLDMFTNIMTFYGLTPDEIYMLTENIEIYKERLE